MRWRHITDANKAAWSENGQSSDASLRGPGSLGTLDADVPTAPPMEAGTLYRIEVDMWSTALIVNAGHSVRLTVTSSNDPRFSVNPNTGQGLAGSPRKPPVVAENAVAHDSEHPSALVLPIVPLAAVRALPTMPPLPHPRALSDSSPHSFVDWNHRSRSRRTCRRPRPRWLQASPASTLPTRCRATLWRKHLTRM